MSTDVSSRRTIFSGTLLLLLAVGSMVFLNLPNVQTPYIELTGRVLAFEEPAGRELTVTEALNGGEWGPATEGLLKATRRHSTLWLRFTLDSLHEDSGEAWLEVAPWRVGNVDLFFLDDHSGQVIAYDQIGPDVPLNERRIRSARNLLPIHFAEGSPVDLLVRVESENRPMISLRLWDRAAVEEQDKTKQLQHAGLFGCVLALVAILLLRLKFVFMTLALWLLASFAMQAEQEGYLTFQTFGEWQHMGLAMRMTLWHVALVSFLTSAVLLLDLRRRRHWKLFYWPGVTLIVLLVLAQGLFSENTLRAISAYLSLAVLLVWPLSLSVSVLRENSYKQILLILFVLSWLESVWFTVDYIFAFKYDGVFSVSAVLIRLGIIVGIIGLFSLEQRMKRESLERALLDAERRQNRRLEKAVALRTRALQTAVVDANNANRAKIDFLGRVSHDLRSPLTTIIGYSQLLQAEKGAIERKAGVILKSANHMLALVNDLIDYARGSFGNALLHAPVNFYSVLDSVASEAQLLASRRNNKFSLEVSGCIPPVLEVDEKRLRQVLINLLDNSAKFTRNGVIGLAVAPKLCAKSGCVELSFCVHDTGQGIATEDLPNLFVPFFRGPSGEAEGSGLGLAIVEHWLKQMGGNIRVDSAVGKGTRIEFSLTFNMVCDGPSPGPQHLPSSTSVPSVQGGGHKIWVVEDNEDIRNLLMEHLVDCQFDVQTAVDGEDCLSRLMVSSAEPPALVLTDYVMPNLNGAELLRALRDRWPDVPVVLISAAQHTLSQIESISAFNAALTKPIDLVVLRRTLARILHLKISDDDLPNKLHSDRDAAVCELGQLDQNRLKELRDLLDAGAVTDIFDWVRRLPYEHSVLANHMRPLVELCDLDAICVLLDDALLEKP